VTSRERLFAAAELEPVDRKPTLYWPGEPSGEGDALIVPSWMMDDLSGLVVAEGIPVLAEVINPFGKSRIRGIDLNDAFRLDPDIGQVQLDEFIEETEDEMRQALQAGADGIFYRVHGARAVFCTPMEYGGRYLESDRQILNSVSDARFNLVFIVGGNDVYLDFVSDLPAHVFGWDAESSGITCEAVRFMRNGALAAATEDADIVFHHPKAGATNIVEFSEESEFAHNGI